MTDARIGIVKAVLQLTPEQAKYWPAVEEAIRARAQTRYQRIAAVAERLGQQRAVDPVELLRGRADALAQRAAGLKKLADALQPLYQSLSPETKTWHPVHQRHAAYLDRSHGHRPGSLSACGLAIRGSIPTSRCHGAQA